MKQLFVVVLTIIVGCSATFAQTQTKSTKKKQSATIKKQKLPVAKIDLGVGQSTAIDSFKRSNRYTPGKPYDTLETKKADVSNDKPGQAVASGTPLLSSKKPDSALIPTQKPAACLPAPASNVGGVMPGNVNSSAPENSTNAASDINRVQLNALNNPQNPPGTNNANSTQNNWGRNTTGEGQWSPPINISSGFSKEFPAISGATWSRDIYDTLNYMARYQVGSVWTTSTYNPNGERLDTRTQLDLDKTPKPVALFFELQFPNARGYKITRVERPNRPDVYELRNNSGRVVFVDSTGREAQF